MNRMEKIIEKTPQNLKILSLVPTDILERVPVEKAEEFQWGILIYLQNKMF